MITYNQEAYIGKALQSTLRQKTNFNYEILVGDDSSSDKTPKIVKEYTSQYPDKVKAILRKHNIGANKNFFDLLNKAKGKYIALCEGDDYWTDENKLQKQANYLERRSDCTVCFHPVAVHYERGDRPDGVFPVEKSSFTLDTLLDHNFIQTNSVMYRKFEKYIFPKVTIMPGDWYMHIYHARFGKIGFINQVMATYRQHDNGIWSTASKNIELFWHNQAINHLSFFVEVSKLFRGDEHKQKIIDNSAANVFSSIVDDILGKDDSTVKTAITNFPDIVCEHTKRQKHKIDELIEQVKCKDTTIVKKDRIILEKDQQIAKLVNSKTYKIGKIITTPYKIFRRILKK
jgi:glycosyltransferase involved in cell wall biosynthesis